MALSGRHLNITVAPWPPWMTYGENFANMKGVVWDVLLILEKHLNFTFTLVPSIDGTFGSDFGNGTVTGMVGMVHRKEVDFGLGPFTVTHSRSRAVDFSNPMNLDFDAILLPRPKVEKDAGNFLKPFPLQIWLAIIFGLTSVAILGHLLARSSAVQRLMVSTSRYDEPSKRIFFRPLWIIKIFTSDVVNHSPAISSAKMFVGTLFIAHLFLSSAYSAVLTSLLAVPKVYIPVDSLEDLLEYGKIPWAATHGTAESIMFLNARNGTNKLFKAIGEKLLDVSSCPSGSRRTKAEGIAILCGFLTLKRIVHEDFSTNGFCNFYIAKEKIAPTINAMIFPKQSPLFPIFNKRIDILRESGIVDKLLFDTTQNATTCLLKPGSENKNRIIVFGIEDLGGIFLLLVAGTLLGLCVFVMEIFIFKFRQMFE